MAELSNLVVLLKNGGLSTLDARVYLGGVELAARRDIARKIRRRAGKRAEKAARYSIHELITLTQETTLTSVKRALKRLENAGLLRFETQQIETTKTGLFPEEPLCLELEKRGALSRIVPIPRRLFTELCREKKKSVFLAKLAYIIRGLTLDKKTGELRSRGCIKASWIAKHFGLSLRTVRLARQFLIQCGFIEKDCASFQRKLNRDGSYFEINLSQYAGTVHAEKEHKCEDIATVPAHLNADSAGTLAEAENTAQDLSPAQNAIAPLQAEKCPQFAPPIEKPETPNGSKNQKPRFAEAGVCRANGIREAKARNETVHIKVKNPTLRNIQFEDLRRVPTLKMLFHQAVLAKWLADSEANFRNFVAAAVRATRIQCSDPVRVFVAIVRRQLWHHITQEQEDRAAEVIRRDAAKQCKQERICAEPQEKDPKLKGTFLTAGDSGLGILNALNLAQYAGIPAG